MYIFILKQTKEKNYICSYGNCGKTFITLGNLKSHEFQHGGKKPFACTFSNCNLTYSRQNRLDIHVRTHVTCYANLVR